MSTYEIIAMYREVVEEGLVAVCGVAMEVGAVTFRVGRVLGVVPVARNILGHVAELGTSFLAASLDFF